MPHLKYNNRYWRVAGDEFSVPALCSITARLSWSALISIILGVSFNSMVGCDNGWILVTYLFFSIFLFLISIMCDVAIMVISLKGSIIETEKRADLGKFISYRLSIGVAQFFCAIFGVISIADTHIPCSSELEGNTLNRIFVAIVVASQLVDVTSLCCCCYLFSAHPVDTYESTGPRETIVAVDEWESRCKKIMRYAQLLTCNLFGGGNLEGFEEVAKVLTSLFHHDGFLDVVPSDVAAGIVLVRVEQRNRRMNRITGQQIATRNRKISHSHSATYFGSMNNNDNMRDIESGGGGGGGGGGRSGANNSNYGLNGDTVTNHGTSESPLSFSGGDTLLISTATDESGSSNKHKASTVTNRNNNNQTQMINLTKSSSPHSNTSTATTADDDECSITDLSVLEEMARCSFFALAMYTHFITLYMKPCSGICRLVGSSACSADRAVRSGPACGAPCCCITGKRNLKRDEDVVIEGDNDCGFHYAGMQVITQNLENTEVLYASFVNDTCHKPYAVILDHQKQFVVVTIRGTLSLEDCITDALCEPAEMDAAGAQWGFNGKGRWAHEGMLKAALQIRSELEKSGILNRIYCGASGGNGGDGGGGFKAPLNKRGFVYLQDGDHSHYKLMITGHSLGAGTAAILAVLLRNAFPNLTCYTFGTPGSVLDKQSSEEYSSFIYSIVLSNDLVPRLNFHSMCLLRNEVLDAICRAKVSKMQVMQAMFRDFENDDLMYPAGEEPDSEFRRSILQYQTIIRGRMETFSHVELCLPGKIALFVKQPGAKSWLFGPAARYQLQEAAIEDFSFITVSSTMVADHMPDRYAEEMSKALASLVMRV